MVTNCSQSKADLGESPQADTMNTVSGATPLPEGAYGNRLLFLGILLILPDRTSQA